MSECRAPKRKSVISPHLTQNRCQWPASRFRPLPRRLRVDSAKHDDRTKPESQTLWNATVSPILPWFNSVREVRFSNGYLTVHLDRPRTEGFSKWKRLQQNQKLHPLVTDLFRKPQPVPAPQSWRWTAVEGQADSVITDWNDIRSFLCNQYCNGHCSLSIWMAI